VGDLVLSTLTDLFNVRIGAAKKSVFLCREKDSYWILRAPEKLPLKEGLEVSRIDGDSVEGVLSEIGVEKESIYYLLPPGLYFRNRITLPFTDAQKIEGIIRYEVKEYLPNPDGDYFSMLWGRWLTTNHTCLWISGLRLYTYSMWMV